MSSIRHSHSKNTLKIATVSHHRIQQGDRFTRKRIRYSVDFKKITLSEEKTPREQRPSDSNQDGMLMVVVGTAYALYTQTVSCFQKVYASSEKQMKTMRRANKRTPVNLESALAFQTVIYFTKALVIVGDGGLLGFHHSFGQTETEARNAIRVQKFPDRCT